MRPLLTGFLADSLSYVSTVVYNASNRWLHAVDKIEDPNEQYTSEELIADLYKTWKDTISWPLLGNVGGLPYNAFIRVDRWVGAKTSNPVPKLLKPTPVGQDTLPIPGVPDPIRVSPLTMVGANAAVFPQAHVAVRDSYFSVAIALENLGGLQQNPPPNGHYLGLLHQNNNVLAHVHVLVQVPAP